MPGRIPTIPALPLGTNPLHGAQTPLYGFCFVILLKCTSLNIDLQYVRYYDVNWVKENKLFYSILFYFLLY
jgi:hypothetical protein